MIGNLLSVLVFVLLVQCAVSTRAHRSDINQGSDTHAASSRFSHEAVASALAATSREDFVYHLSRVDFVNARPDFETTRRLMQKCAVVIPGSNAMALSRIEENSVDSKAYEETYYSAFMDMCYYVADTVNNAVVDLLTDVGSRPDVQSILPQNKKDD